MATTVKGYQGTISDVDLATQFPHHAPSVYGPNDLAVTAVNGSRTVSVAAGTALAAFVKYTSDAPQTLNLAPPNSGVKYYAISLNRQWSPTSTCVLQADDLGVTDAMSASGFLPASVFTALAALPDQPGTAGSTAGARQVLAVVQVRAADTTLTIGDLRFVRTKGGTFLVNNLHALRWAGIKTDPGSIVTFSGNTPNGIIGPSTWANAGAGWRPVGKIRASSLAALADIERAYTDAGYPFIVDGSDCLGTVLANALGGAAVYNGITYRWQPGQGWFVWDVPGNCVDAVFLMQGDVTKDGGPGQNSVVIRGGVLTYNFSLYSGNQRQANGGGVFGQFYPGFRPADGAFAQSPGVFYDSGYGFLNNVISSDGYLVCNQKQVGGNGGGGVNALRGTISWRIS